MTEADIEAMARECISEDWGDHLPGWYRNMNFARFAALVAAKARAEAPEEAGLLAALAANHWFDSPETLVVTHARNLKLGSQTYTGDRLVEAIRAAQKEATR